MRAGSSGCNRECEKCDLLQEDVNLIMAYDTVIKILELFFRIENNFNGEKFVIENEKYFWRKFCRAQTQFKIFKIFCLKYIPPSR